MDQRRVTAFINARHLILLGQKLKQGLLIFELAERANVIQAGAGNFFQRKSQSRALFAAALHPRELGLQRSQLLASLA